MTTRRERAAIRAEALTEARAVNSWGGLFIVGRDETTEERRADEIDAAIDYKHEIDKAKGMRA